MDEENGCLRVGFRAVFRLIAGAIDRNIDITIFVYVSAQRFKRMYAFEDKNKRYRKQLTELGGSIVLRSRPRATMFAVSFKN